MGNCKDCKFWKSNFDKQNDWSTCEAVEWVDRNCKICDADFTIYADASDDTGLVTGLKTGPLFGCIKFQSIKKD